MSRTDFSIENGPRTNSLKELKKLLENQKKEVVLAFENGNEIILVKVRNITECKQTFHICGTVTKGRFKNSGLHAQYSSKDRTGHVWIT